MLFQWLGRRRCWSLAGCFIAWIMTNSYLCFARQLIFISFDNSQKKIKDLQNRAGNSHQLSARYTKMPDIWNNNNNSIRMMYWKCLQIFVVRLWDKCVKKKSLEKLFTLKMRYASNAMRYWCVLLMCDLRLCRCLARKLQNGHSNCASTPHSKRSCLDRVYLRAYVRLHRRHG